MSTPVPTIAGVEFETALRRVRRATEAEFLAVAMRLVSQEGDVEQAARRLVSVAPGHNIDLSLVWGIFEGDRGGGVVARQCCMLVPGAGRTVMAFVSEPARAGTQGGTEGTGLRDRAACVTVAVEAFERLRPGVAAVAQSLPAPEDRWASEALLASGFGSVGVLEYLRLEPETAVPKREVEAGWALQALSDVPMAQRRGLLLGLLEASYAQTLDCPELCGLRSTEDILDSHLATGLYDPRMWWIVRTAEGPVGCVLMSSCPDQRLVELVYLGLALEGRGKGWSRDILSVAVSKVRERYRSWPITCAVDQRNEPARRLYARLGFHTFGTRLALVRAMRSSRETQR